MKVNIKMLDKNAKKPNRAKYGDAGFDLVATSVEKTDKYISYGTGLSFEIPYGYVGLLFPRSSVTNKDLILKNSVGVLDSSFRGEVSFRFYQTESYENNYNVGERIGQIIIIPIPEIEFEFVEELSSTERGAGGYGSSGN